MDVAGARGAAAGADDARAARRHRPARLQLLARPRRLRRPARPARRRAPRADARGRRHLPGARRVPGRPCRSRCSRRRRSVRRAVTGRDRPARLRRARRHDRAARHRRRPRASVPARPDPRRDRPVDGGDDATAHANPQDPSQLERHGTELAGLLVGAGGPGGLHGVAPGATVLPIRVAGWQPAPTGTTLVYGRSDQLIAGLDRAVDPNGDGDAHDAVRVALVGVVEPYAAFADGPEARAVQGALDLNTLVVTPAGNDGAAGPSFGSVAGPGRRAGRARRRRDGLARRAAARARRAAPRPRRHPRPLAAAARRRRAAPLADAARRDAALDARARRRVVDVDFFDAKGFSLVAGPRRRRAGRRRSRRRRRSPPRARARPPSCSTAALPAGLAARRRGRDRARRRRADRRGARAAGGAARGDRRRRSRSARAATSQPRARLVAGFSSRGLAFDGGVKPDVAAPGVALATAEPGAAPTARRSTGP